MRKKICKLIISISFIIAAFVGISINAYADPLTAAMIGSSAGMGLNWGAFAGMPTGTASNYADRTGFGNLDTWQDLTGDGVYIRVDEGDTKDTVTLGPDISQSAYDRTRAFDNKYDLAPGTLHNFGNLYSINGYYFSKQYNSNVLQGPIVGYIDGTTNFSIDPAIYFTVRYTNSTPTRGDLYVGNAHTYGGMNNSNTGSSVLFELMPNSNTINVTFYKNGSRSAFSGLNYTNTGVTLDTDSITVSRSIDSEIENPNSGEYQFTVPHGSLSETGYTDGENEYNKSILEQILALLEEIATEEDIEDFQVVHEDPPTPSDTVADTPWTSFTTWFDDYFSGWTEVFGDIYDGITDFQESFGDWVDDVASGWTEVFGDIYDGILDGFSDIAAILEGIYDYVADIVQEIVNADANWVNGFINNFLSQFQDWFDALRQHVSIWHYVVEWLASIRSVFTFFFGVMSNTGYNFVLPIYACFAGTVVIAIYRRFGK